MDKIVASPITQGKCVLEKKIRYDDIMNLYHHTYNIDVQRFFQGIEEVLIFRCSDTGYRFFYPFEIAGDDSFYEDLEKFSWYYMPWKWEHENSLKYLKPGMKVLEVGSANGDYLAHLQDKLVMDVVGLELNKSAAKKSNDRGIHTYVESVEHFAERFSGSLDFVCSFQVVEHISNIHSFIQSQIKLLKQGGILLISVPNNRGFLKDDNNILNIPPHHMGMWTEDSLKKLGEYFDLELIAVDYEPLQSYHADYFINVYLNRFKTIFGERLIRRVFKRMLSFSIMRKLFFSSFSLSYKAFTIQVIFKTRN